MQREENCGATRSLVNELNQQELRAVELENELVAATQELEEAEGANTKVVTRVSSLLTSQTRQSMRPPHSQYQLALSQRDAEIHPHITRDSYESALLQTARLETQLATMKQQFQQLLQRKAEQEDLYEAKVIECKRAFGYVLPQ